jgi:hypothetical protein
MFIMKMVCLQYHNAIVSKALQRMHECGDEQLSWGYFASHNLGRRMIALPEGGWEEDDLPSRRGMGVGVRELLSSFFLEFSICNFFFGTTSVIFVFPVVFFQ